MKLLQKNNTTKIKDFCQFRNPKRISKKGQITLFIIIGIIILLGAILFFSTREETIRRELGTEVELAIAVVPIEFRPVASLVENCLTQIAQEGVTKLGERGGFIDLVRHGINTVSDTTNSDAVQFFPESDLSVAYWWYLKSPNECSGDCEFKIIPENNLYLKKQTNTPSIESQLEDYIKENLRRCLNDFEELKAQGFTIKELGDIEPTVLVAQSDIIAYIDYPIEIERAGKEKLSRFFIRLPLNIQRIYGIAKTLTDLEGERHFLERDVLNLIVGFSGVNRAKLPPMSETKFELGSPVTWQMTDVEQNIKNMLTDNIQLLQVFGTNNYEPKSFPGNSLLESLYNTGMLVPGSVDYSDLNIRFDYKGDWWDTYLSMNCDETCEPESLISDLIGPLIPIKNYNFIYDLSFPVEVTIHDPTAFNNRGYTFKFFLEGNIRANEPMPTDFSPLEGAFPVTTMLCDNNKRNSGEITIDVKDYITDEGIEDVQIAYSSFEENCLIGSTENGTFKGRFPVMLGGAVSFIKDDYISYTQRFDTKLEKDDSLDIVLTPILTKKFTIKKKRLVKDLQRNFWPWNGTPIDLKENEQATITLTRIGTLQEGEFTSPGVYSGDQTGPSEILIAPGTYEISINLIYNEPIRIPHRTIEIDDESFTIQEFTTDEGFRVGGLDINYTFKKVDLEKDEITFYVLNPDIVAIPESQRIIEDLTVVSDVDRLSQKRKLGLVPK